MRIPPAETTEQADLREAPSRRAAPAEPPADPRKIAQKPASSSSDSQPNA
jgi:hypothetical protein